MRIGTTVRICAGISSDISVSVPPILLNTRSFCSTLSIYLCHTSSSFSSSRLCLDFSLPSILDFSVMRGSSLKSTSQNRTCPIKAYGSSVSLSPNMHLLGISLDMLAGVFAISHYISSTLANRIDLFVSWIPLVLALHICKTSVTLCCFRRFRNICNVLAASRSVLQSCLLYFHACAPTDRKSVV